MKSCRFDFCRVIFNLTESRNKQVRVRGVHDQSYAESLTDYIRATVACQLRLFNTKSSEVGFKS